MNYKLRKTQNTALLAVFFVLCFVFLNTGEASAATIGRPQNNLGLVGYWDFDIGKNGITAYDRSGQGNHGTLTNMEATTDWVDGKVGQALSFDGVNDYVNAGNDSSLNISDKATISAWVKVTSWFDWEDVWGKSSDDAANRINL